MKMMIPMAAAAALFAGCATTSERDCCCATTEAKACACAKATCACVAPNTLTCQEKAEGWQLLWDGATTKGWVGEKCDLKTFPAKGWKIENGVLTVLPNGYRDKKTGKYVKLPADKALGGGGDIVTEKLYKDFAFKFDFKLTEAANSGIKYFYDKAQFKGTCEEYQVLDVAHPDYHNPNPSGLEGTHRIAALYDLKATANAEKYVRPLGEWNTGMVVSKGNHVEHWLNGVKVVEYDRGSAEFRALVKGSKYAKEAKGDQHWGEIPAGRIKIQDHSDSTVHFRNLKIREF